MKVDPKEQALGIRWFFGAGLFALLLLGFVVEVDEKLRTWDRENNVNETLRELRTAQYSLPSRVTDQRQLNVTVEHSVPEAPGEAAPHEHH